MGDINEFVEIYTKATPQSQDFPGQDTHATSLNIPICVGEHAHVGFWNRVTEMCFPCSIWEMQRVKCMPWSITSRAEMLGGLGLDAWWIHLSSSSFSVWNVNSHATICFSKSQSIFHNLSFSLRSAILQCHMVHHFPLFLHRSSEVLRTTLQRHQQNPPKRPDCVCLQKWGPAKKRMVPDR